MSLLTKPAVLALGGVGFLLLGGAAYAHTASSRIAATLDSADWLAAAEDEVGFGDFLNAPLVGTAQLKERLGRKAISALYEDPYEITGLAAANKAATGLTHFHAGCNELGDSLGMPICSASSRESLYNSIDEQVRGSVIDADYFIDLEGSKASVEEKQFFSFRVCNLYPQMASTQVKVDFSENDRLNDDVSDLRLDAGGCASVLSKKLREAPKVSGEASAKSLRSNSSAKNLQWSTKDALSSEKVSVVWGLGDRQLCHTSVSQRCGGQKITNPAAYAKGLAKSLDNDKRVSRQIESADFPFAIGVLLDQTGPRDHFGTTVQQVFKGGPAASAGLRAGDRIVSVGQQVVFSNLDVILAVDAHGQKNGVDEKLTIEVLRNGKPMTAQIVLGFNKAYWDARGYGEWYSFFATAADVLTLGNGDTAYCYWFRKPSQRMKWSSLRESYKQCIARWDIERDMLPRVYKVGYYFGVFAASRISPLRFFSLGVVAGNSPVARYANSLIMQTIEQAITETFKSTQGDTPVDILEELVIQAPEIAISSAISMHR